MEVTKKELADFLHSFGDPADYYKLEPRTRASVRKLWDACNRYWFLSKADNYVVSQDEPTALYKFKEILSERDFLATSQGRVIRDGVEDCYLDLYAILKRDKMLSNCLREPPI